MRSEQYNEETREGKLAEALVSGVLRGGFIVGEWFYFHSRRPEKVLLSECLEVKEIGFYV